jgi:hypothetical protein
MEGLEILLDLVILFLIRVDSLPNNWSKVGNIGDPITIITNGLHNQSPSYDSITENINSDKSSAYFTSTQQIPIEVASTNDYLSYDRRAGDS